MSKHVKDSGCRATYGKVEQQLRGRDCGVAVLQRYGYDVIDNVYGVMV
jgi:hypothetical protein